MRKFTLKELTLHIGHLQSLFTLPFSCEVCERERAAEVIVVTKTFVPVGVCLTCATTLIAYSVKNKAPLSTATISNGADRMNKPVAKRGRPRKAVR